uniref:rRNA biogenesis protein RRP36 n=1 Tax=Panagrolaimus davidi TaxID=227884 RepID=A0A914QQ37_9BILA
MAKNFQDGRKGKNQKNDRGSGGHKFDNKMKGKNNQNFKNKNNKFGKKDWKNSNKQKKGTFPLIQSEFTSRPQQGSFPDKKKVLDLQRTERQNAKRFGKQNNQKRNSFGKESEENMAKHLKKSPSKNWVNREIDENQSFASDSEDVEIQSDEDEKEKIPIKSFEKKSEAKKNPFEMFDELLDAKKSEANIVVTSDDDEDTVPLANTNKKNPPIKQMEASAFGDIEESDDEDDKEEDDEEMDTEEDDSAAEVSKANDKDSEVVDFHKKISEMSMAQVKALRSKLGTKLFDKFLAESQQKNDSNEVVEESDEACENDDGDEEEADESPKDESSKKKSRHAPREMSSKIPVSVHRTIDPNAINHSRRKFDPRFSERSGTYYENEFRNDYGFIDDLRKNDIQKLNTAMKNAKSKKEKEKIKDLIGRLKSQQKSVEERDLWRETKNDLLTNNIDRMNQGLKPVFVNNKQMKEKFKAKKLGKIEETQGKKGLEKYLKKKEKRESKKKLL